MALKVGDQVVHRLAFLKPSLDLGPGRIVAVLKQYDNTCHNKPGPWYRIEWSGDASAYAGRLFHGDVLEKQDSK